MPDLLPHQLEKLKAALLDASGIKQIIPSDCKRLAANIYAKTNLQVSETTLKRVFGFACTEFKPSSFTISAIAQYCGYSGWYNFVDMLDEDHTPRRQASTWDKISEHAKRVTGFTLQTLRNRSGIPFVYTIPRDLMDQHMDIFSSEPYTATVFTAPAGYGKTIALSHWTAQHAKTHPNDIILYYKVNNIPGTTKVNDLKALLPAMLGIQVDDDIFEAGFFNNLAPRGNFYLIVDGLNDTLQKRGELQHLFTQLTDVISLYRKYSWFKLVLSMRSSTWLEYRYLITTSIDAWFLGFMDGQRQEINLPPFDGKELSRLAYNINPANTKLIKPDDMAAIARPLYFQYHYQAHQQDLLLDQIGPVSIYRTTTAHVVQQVYRGRYNDDKMILLRTFVTKLKEAKGAYLIDRLKLNDLIKHHDAAFRELMSIGILRYANPSNGPLYDSHIEFTDAHLLHFFMAEKLIADNNGSFDEQLITMIDADPILSDNKLPILKWCVYNMATVSGFSRIKWLWQAGLSVTDKSKLIILIGQLMQDRKIKEALQMAPADQDDLFNFIAGAELMDRDHELALTALSKFHLPDEQQLLIKVYLAIIAIIKLDLVNLETYVNEIRSFPPSAGRCLPLDPVHCLESMYFYLRFGIVKTDPFRDITRFCFNPSVPPGCDSNTNINSIIPMLAICTSIFYKDQRKTNRFINALEKVYPEASTKQNLLLNCWRAMTLADMDQQLATEIFNSIPLGNKQAEAQQPPFTRISYYALKIKLAINDNRPHDIAHDLKTFIRLCDAEDLHLIKVNTIAYILAGNTLTTDPKLTDQLYYDLVKTTRNHNCRADIFYTKPTDTQYQPK